MSSTGPSIRAVCQILNGNVCGSGSVVGRWRSGSLVFTNAHVASSRVGHRVQVRHEQSGRSFTGEVIRAAYSNQVSADWALLFVDGWQDVQPVWMSKSPPATGESLYTKGFPRCQPHAGTDIAQHRTLNNGVLLWLPDAIGGQSGSAVWSDLDNLMRALLTWSMTDGRRRYGAGQTTAHIYRQNRAFVLTGQLVGPPKMPGLTELPDGTERLPADMLPEGIHSIPIERGIADEFPIWAEDQQPEDPPTDPPGNCDLKRRAIDSLRKVREAADTEIAEWEKGLSQPIDPDPDQIHDTFGL